MVGTPGATPAPPAVPAGAVALREAWVPAAAANSAAFPVPAPRLFRRAPFPWSIMSGVIRGCRLRWDLTVDVSAASSAITFSGGVATACIDGEVIDCSSLTGVAVTQDVANNPFGVAAGTSDKPYYIYVVGGRHAPQGPWGSTTSSRCVVECLTAPNVDRAATPPTSRRRVVRLPERAFYIGIGFVVAGTTRRRPCVMGDD